MLNTRRAKIYAALKAMLADLPGCDRVITAPDTDVAVVVPEGKYVLGLILGADEGISPESSVQELKLAALVVVYLPTAIPAGSDDAPRDAEEFASDVCGDIYAGWWNEGAPADGLAINGEVDTFCSGVFHSQGQAVCVQEFTLHYRFVHGDPTQGR